MREAGQARAIVERLLTITADVAVDGAALTRPSGPPSPASGRGPTEDEIDAAAAARAAQAFIAEFAAIRNEVDAMASAGLQRMLEELSALPAMRANRAVVTSRLAEAVLQVHVAASNPRPGHLHVAPVRAGGWSARRRMFIAGADDSKHPGRGLQDPVVLDSERRSLNDIGESHPLALLGDSPRRITEQFNRLVARSGGRAITVSFSELALKDKREHFPAPVFLDLYRRGTGDAGASYVQVERSVPPVGFVDRRPLSASEWWLVRRFADRDPDLRPSVLAAHANLASGAEAEAERSSARLTRWDGRIEVPAEEIDPRRNGRTYSASQLEMMASCPYRYFLARLLRVEPLDDLTFDPDSWLEGREFGTMLHEVLQEAMDELCGAGEKPSLAFLSRMESIAEGALHEWRDAVPPPNEAAFERRRTELLRSVEIFLRSEEDACRQVTPRFFEVSFGLEEESAESIAMPEPLTISLGADAAVQLRGRIDRIDHDEARNEWSVWDYKSGSTWDFDRGGRLQRGRKMQHAIYARALEAMLARKGMSGPVAQSGYFFPTPKGRGARLSSVESGGARACAEHAVRRRRPWLLSTRGRGGLQVV